MAATNNATIPQNYERVFDKVRQAAIRAGRAPDSVRLMAVSKTVAPELVLLAYNSGARLFGENKVPELCEKRAALPQDARVHLIGHLQSNKAAKAAEAADCIQSVDSVKLAQELARRCGQLHKTLEILLEVNIGHDPAKFGFLPAQTEEAMLEIAALPELHIKGLMTVPPFEADEKQLARYFTQMQTMRMDINAKKWDKLQLDVLSMGMSHDFELAIACGSDLVRVGSAIFGTRV